MRDVHTYVRSAVAVISNSYYLKLFDYSDRAYKNRANIIDRFAILWLIVSELPSNTSKSKITVKNRTTKARYAIQNIFLMRMYIFLHSKPFVMFHKFELLLSPASKFRIMMYRNIIYCIIILRASRASLYCFAENE